MAEELSPTAASFACSASLPVFRDTRSHGADAVLLEFPEKSPGG